MVEVPNGPEVNYIIGQKGVTINQLQSQTGTHVAIQRAHETVPGATVRQVTISGGDETARALCADLIKAKVAEYAQQGQQGSAGGAAAAEPAIPPSMVVEIPNGPEVNYIIGQKGVTINQLQSETGTHVAIQRAHEVPEGSTVRVVTITGGGEPQRKHCAALIQAKVFEYQSRADGGADANPAAKKPKFAPAPVPMMAPPPAMFYPTAYDPSYQVNPYGVPDANAVAMAQAAASYHAISAASGQPPYPHSAAAPPGFTPPVMFAPPPI